MAYNLKAFSDVLTVYLIAKKASFKGGFPKNCTNSLLLLGHSNRVVNFVDGNHFWEGFVEMVTDGFFEMLSDGFSEMVSDARRAGQWMRCLPEWFRWTFSQSQRWLISG